jgi:hypothetical protein
MMKGNGFGNGKVSSAQVNLYGEGLLLIDPPIMLGLALPTSYAYFSEGCLLDVFGVVRPNLVTTLFPTL